MNNVERLLSISYQMLDRYPPRTFKNLWKVYVDFKINGVKFEVEQEKNEIRDIITIRPIISAKPICIGKGPLFP